MAYLLLFPSWVLPSSIFYPHTTTVLLLPRVGRTPIGAFAANAIIALRVSHRM